MVRNYVGKDCQLNIQISLRNLMAQAACLRPYDLSIEASQKLWVHVRLCQKGSLKNHIICVDSGLQATRLPVVSLPGRSSTNR